MVVLRDNEDLKEWVAERLSDPRADAKYRITPTEQGDQNDLTRIIEGYKHIRINEDGSTDVVVDCTVVTVTKTMYSRDDNFVRIGEQWIREKTKVDRYLRRNQGRIEHLLGAINNDDESYRSLWQLAGASQDIVDSMDKNKELTLSEAKRELERLEALTGRKFSISVENIKKDIKDIRDTIKALSDLEFTHKSIMFTMLLDAVESLNLPVLFAEGSRRPDWIVPAYLQWLRISGWKHIRSLKGANTTGTRLTNTGAELIDGIREEIVLREVELFETLRREAELLDIPHVPQITDERENEDDTESEEESTEQ